MKILIVGGDGMMGHQAVQYFSKAHDVSCTVRKKRDTLKTFKIYDFAKVYYEMDAVEHQSISNLIHENSYNVVINCIGIVKQRELAKDAIEAIEINSLFPHRLAASCKDSGARLIHISTDCVFSGSKGNYRESDLPDATDMYGRSKLLGEVDYSHCFTFRTSIIGPEIFNHKSLIAWFLSQRGKVVRGYTNAIYSGVTTLELCRAIDFIVSMEPKKSGLYHFSSDPISKFELLSKLNRFARLETVIEPYEEFVNDKSLDSSRFFLEMNYPKPLWDNMLMELAQALHSGF